MLGKKALSNFMTEKRRHFLIRYCLSLQIYFLPSHFAIPVQCMMLNFLSFFCFIINSLCCYTIQKESCIPLLSQLTPTHPSGASLDNHLLELVFSCIPLHPTCALCVNYNVSDYNPSRETRSLCSISPAWYGTRKPQSIAVAG